MRQEQMEAGSGQRTHGTPVGSRTRSRRVTGREQHRQLMRSQALGAACRSRGPPREAALGKPLVTKPESLAIVGEQLQRRPFAIAEHEHRTDEWILTKGFLAKPRQAINASAKIGRLDSHQDLHLRRNLKHHSALQNLRARTSTSTAS